MNSETKSLKDWLTHYNKILTDGYYSYNGKKLMLYDDDKEYIRKEIAKIEEEIKNGR